ncbi:hypothetical protein BDV18DRAFT_112802 [Aspergillus unguis]
MANRYRTCTAPNTADDSQVSDNDGGERPVRNKLKETTITSAPNTSTEGEAQRKDSSRASSRGRKRSFDDDEEDNNDEEAGHRRKRSRDSNTEDPSTVTAVTLKLDEDEIAQQEGLQQSGSGLKKKRSRDQLDKDESKPESKEKADVKDTTDTGASTGKAAAEGEPEKKRHRDDSQERDPAPLPSAFANTSSMSPFGATGSSTKQPAADAKPAATTSSSAFASSSLAAFAGSEQSPFGSLGASTPSVFKSSAESTPAETEKPAATGFAAAAKPSGFAALSSGSGFSGFGGGFGAAAASSGGGLTSFAAPGGSALLGSTSAKPFGAEADSDDEEEKKEDEAESGPAEFEADKTDERFFERQIETGEEEEKTYFACKAKLFYFADKEWRERGIGNFKVNVKITDGVEDKKSARMIMRADGVLRVMLNTPLFVGMKVGDAKGQEPRSTKQIHLASLEAGRSVPLLLRTGSEEQAKELYHTLQELLKHQ